MIGDSRPWTVGQVAEVDGPNARLLVLMDGGQVWLPHAAGTYTVDDTVAVLRDPYRAGAGQFVLGQIGAAPTPDALPEVPAEEFFTTVIRPSGSASYRTSVSAWDRWTTIASSDLADLYQQGAAPTYTPPGEIHGLAWYGSQISGLGASTISSVDVALVHNGSGYGAVAFTVQGTAASSRPAGAPSPSGDTVASSAIGPGGRTSVRLPATLAEDLRTGAAASLALVGSGYGGLKGYTHPEGMALTISGWKVA